MRKVPWIVANQIPICRAASERTEDIVPIMNAEQLYSIPPYQAKFTRKEVDIELLGVGWMADRYLSRSQRLLPSFDGRLSDRSMHTLVINFNDLWVSHLSNSR